MPTMMAPLWIRCMYGSAKKASEYFTADCLEFWAYWTWVLNSVELFIVFDIPHATNFKDIFALHKNY